MKTKHLILLTATLALASCNRLDVTGMFFSSGTHTEDRVAQWLEWNDQHPATVINGAPDQYNIYVCSDIHLEGNTDRISQFLQHEYADPSGLFSIVNGDLANESGSRPFRQLDSLLRLPSATDTSTANNTSSNTSTHPPTPSPSKPSAVPKTYLSSSTAATPPTANANSSGYANCCNNATNTATS